MHAMTRPYKGHLSIMGINKMRLTIPKIIFQNIQMNHVMNLSWIGSAFLSVSFGLATSSGP